MIKMFFAWVLCSCLLFACASGALGAELPEGVTFPIEDSGQPEIEWSGDFIGVDGSNDSIISACETDDGYVAASITKNSEGVNDSYIVKFDRSGAKVWEQIYPATYFLSIAKVPEGFLVSANISEGEGESEIEHGKVILAGEDGKEKWSYVLQGSKGADMGFLKEAAVRPNGNYLVQGITQSNDGDFEGMAEGRPNGYAFLAEFTPSGQLAKIYPFGGSAGDVIEGVTMCADGGAILTGIVASDDGIFEGMEGRKNGDVDALIMKLDAGLQIEWISQVHSTGTDWGVSAYETEDGGFIYGGSTDGDDGDFATTPQVGKDVPFLAKFDKDGKFLWAKTYPMGQKEDEGCWTNSCEPTMDGRFILSGMTYSESFPEHFGAIVVVDRDGNLVLNRLYSIDGAESVSHVYGASDGGMFTAGSFSSENGDSNGSVVKFAKLP